LYSGRKVVDRSIPDLCALSNLLVLLPNQGSAPGKPSDGQYVVARKQLRGKVNFDDAVNVFFSGGTRNVGCRCCDVTPLPNHIGRYQKSSFLFCTIHNSTQYAIKYCQKIVEKMIPPKEMVLSLGSFMQAFLIQMTKTNSSSGPSFHVRNLIQAGMYSK
jgi:hypothetical protein